MNTITQLPPKKPAAEFSTDGPTIVVRIAITDPLFLLLFHPENNRIATRLLCRILVAQIEATGASVRSALPAYPFNRSFYIFDLNRCPFGAALEAIRHELSELRLLEFSQIAWHDPHEAIFRMYYPETGVFEVPTESQARAESELLEGITKQLQAKGLRKIDE